MIWKEGVADWTRGRFWDRPDINQEMVMTFDKAEVLEKGGINELGVSAHG